MKHFFKKKTLKLTLLFSSLVIVMSCGVAIVLAVMSYTGYTDLTTSGQTIKASSAPTAILGININNGGDGQTLTSVSVDFTSVSGFTNNDLASGKVGITIYDDSGASHGVFDASDADVGASVNWTGLTATINTAGTAIPVDNAGDNAGDDFFVVIKTSADIANGDQFTATLGTNSITTSDPATGGATSETTYTITGDTGIPDAPVIEHIAGDELINDSEKAAIIVTGTAEAGSLVTVT
ncbi:MAG: hypothetical protein PHH83_00860, partial [Patescibacteria group bacterium]|nr:hypothetical protein [Patescibacteria group bacterium]